MTKHLVFKRSTGVIESRPAIRTNKRNFSMAQGGRLFSDWTGSTDDFNESLRSAFQTMVRRGRDLSENNPLCVRFLRLMDTNILGHNGIQLVPTPRNADGKLDMADAQTLRQGWRKWGQLGTCTMDGMVSWRMHESECLKSFLSTGEFIRRFVPTDRNEFGIAVHMVDPLRLDPTYNRPASDRNYEIRNGVERDEWGKPMAYHFLTGDVSTWGYGGPHERIEAEFIDHFFIRERPGQCRGVTWLAPVGARQKMLDGYEMAAVTAARVASSKMGFFQRTGEMDPAWGEGVDEMPPEDVAPGMFEILPDGYEFKDFDPSWPGADYDDFSKSIKRSIAAGLNQSYNTLSMDLEGVSWSGLRKAELDDHDFYRCMQTIWAEVSQDRTYAVWLRFALDFGALRLPPGKYEKFREVRHRPRSWQWVDPKKQQEAKTLGLLNGSLTMTNIVEEDLGLTLEEYKQIIDSEHVTLGDMHPLNWLIPNPPEEEPPPVDPADPES